MTDEAMEHECDFGQADGFGQPVPDTAVCRICGRSVMSGFELAIDWSVMEEDPDQEKP